MIFFLIGKHGVGKSTIGNLMVQQSLVSHHISIGDLVRMCRRKHRSDLPFGLYLDLSMHRSGMMFSEDLAKKLLSYIIDKGRGSNISVDGFPSMPEHLSMLPCDAVVIHITTSDENRHQRLINRSESSVRKWSKEMPESDRDAHIDQVLELSRSRGNFLVVENDDDVMEAVQLIRQKSGQIGRTSV